MQFRSIFSGALFLAALTSFGVTGCHDSPVDPAPCHTEVLVGGVDDNFAAGNEEPAAPSPELVNYMLENYYNPYLEHRFDQTTIDRPVGHTFHLAGVDAAHPAVVTKAVFTMRIRTVDPTTDWFHLMVNDGAGGVRGIYDASIHALYGGYAEPWTVKTVTLDLGELGLLDELSDGVLHMYLQDDTAVDFVQLEVEYCGTCGDRDDIGLYQ